MARRLTLRQRRFVEEYVKNGGNATDAVVKAGYNSSGMVAASVGSENLNKPNIRAEMEATLRRMNLGPDRIAKVVDRALEAESTMVVGDGKTITRPDHGTQLKAADMLAKLADAYPTQAAQRSDRHLHLHQVTEPIEVMRFRVMHGRAPTERELADLGCVNSVEKPVIEAECEQVPDAECADDDAK